MTARGPDASGCWTDRRRRVALANRPLGDHRPLAAGAQPMAFGRRPLPHHLQRRDLQLPRACARELERRRRRASAAAATPRCCSPLYAREGARHAAAAARHVRLRAVGRPRERRCCSPATPSASSRSTTPIAGGQLRFASQVKALLAGGGLSPGRRPRRGRRLPAVGLRARAAHPHESVRAAARRALHDGRRRPRRALRSATTARTSPAAPPRWRGAAARRAALADSVAAHLVADVPVGLFLSAGLDSPWSPPSHGAACPSRPPPSPSASRSQRGTAGDEGPIAARVAAALGTRHLEVGSRRPSCARCGPRPSRRWTSRASTASTPSSISRAAHEAGSRSSSPASAATSCSAATRPFATCRSSCVRRSAAAAFPGLAAFWPRLARLRAADEARRPAALRLFRRRRLPSAARPLPARGAAGVLGRERAAKGSALRPAGLRGRRAEAAPPTHRRSLASGDVMALGTPARTARYLRNQLLRDSDWASMA